MGVAAEVGSTANRYQILAKLAVGGMAEIYLARGASVAGVERYCVLKRILRERATDEQLVRMFVDEARLAAQLQHPNIASVYDVGTLGDSFFFTMEYVHGETVRALLHRAHTMSRPLPLACVMTTIAGAAAGLHHAHERHAADGRPLGIVHRDVSPSNLMISFEGHIKLVDFGVAKAADRETETRTGTVKGKISYLSPEQCRGVPVDRRSDIFSLGIVMWEMLTGQRLFRRNSDFENMTAIVHEQVVRPSARRPDLSPAIDAIAMKMLAKDPAQRYQTADDVVEAIENASMRAGTILSTSAVSRLMRDLFGVRPEPWRQLESAAMPHEVATVMSQPIDEPLEESIEPIDPRETDPAEPVLASVPDLSHSGRMYAEQEPSDPGQEVDPGSIYSVSTIAPLGFEDADTTGDGPDDVVTAQQRSAATDEVAPLAPPAPAPDVGPEARPEARRDAPRDVPRDVPRDLPLTETLRDPRVSHAPTVRMSPADLLASVAQAP
ncbi:MAG TPA: serine/threonine-protein kinase, partial [Kofleriaceae bacterium]